MSLLLLSRNKKVEKLFACISVGSKNSIRESNVISPRKKINKDVDRIVLIDSDAGLMVIGKGIRIFIVSKMQT